MVITYDPQYKNEFKALNLAWIERYFKAESKDLQQLSAPNDCLEEGGQIFFVLVDGQAVGTCALYNKGKGVYELAKMAVEPKFHGRGFGNLLMRTAEDWARSVGASEIMILSNTVLETAITLYQKHGFKVVKLGPHPDYARCDIELSKVLVSGMPNV